MYRLIFHGKTQGGKINEQMQIKKVGGICHVGL